MCGIYSLITSRIVLAPGEHAVCVKSRSRRLRICERIRRASQAQPKNASSKPRVTRFRLSRHQHCQHDDDQEERDAPAGVSLKKHQRRGPCARPCSRRSSRPVTAMMRDTSRAISGNDQRVAHGKASASRRCPARWNRCPASARRGPHIARDFAPLDRVIGGEERKAREEDQRRQRTQKPTANR